MQRDSDGPSKGRGSFVFAARSKEAGKHRILTILCVIVCALFIAGCAAKAKRPAYKRLPPAEKKQPTTAPSPAEKPAAEPPRMNVRPSTLDVVTPQRQASMRLVEKGRTLADAGDYERAAASFRDAVNVDGSNGIAYYYMAFVDAKLGHIDVALGLLDKAEALLGADAEWMARIDELKTELGVPPSGRPAMPSPIDQAF